MKKLFFLLLAFTFLTPSLVSAQTTPEEEATGCVDGTSCKCTWPYPRTVTGQRLTGQYSVDIPDTTGPEDCSFECISRSGLAAEEQRLAVGTYSCKDGTVPIAPRTEIDEPIIPTLNVKIPGLCDMSEGGKCFGDIELSTTPDGVQHSNILGSYIKAVYAYLLGAGTLIAVVMLMIAGIQYATARGDSKQVDNAKKRIGNAVAGVILLLLAYNIAFLLNPATTTFDSLSLAGVEGIEIDDETPANFEEDYGNTTEEGTTSVPLYNQKDYVDVAYGPEKCNTGDSGNIKSSGCGVVSFAMVVAALTKTTVDPADVAASFYADGYRPLNSSGCGHSGTYNSAMYESRLIPTNGLKARKIPISDMAQLKDLVSKDKLIITSYRTPSGGGHYVVISGYTDDGLLIVSNPWGGVREARSQAWWEANIKSAAYIDVDDPGVFIEK